MKKQVQKENLSELIEVKNTLEETMLKYGWDIVSMESGNGIHLSEEAFKRLFQEFTASPRTCKTYSLRLTAEYKNEKFFCLISKVSPENPKLHQYYGEVLRSDDPKTEVGSRVIKEALIL